MRKAHALAVLVLVLGLPALAAPQTRERSAAPPKPATHPPVPTDAECRPLPSLVSPMAFAPGETLRFELDAMGAKAGNMTMRVLPLEKGLLPLEVKAETNAFFSSVRRVSGSATSYVHPRTLRPKRYYEEALQNDVHRVYDVAFRPKRATVDWRFDQRKGKTELRYSREVFDVAGAVYLARQLPIKEGQQLCVDVYGIRKIWRLYGSFVKKERVSVPLGEFEAWHFAGAAVRLDNGSQRRDVHVWISADERRLPLAALGTIDLGAVRATLVGYERAGEKIERIDDAKSMKW